MRRRDFIAATTASAMLVATPLAASVGNGTGGRVVRYALAARATKQRLGPEDAPETDLWLVNGVSPGPLIEARQGDELEVTFTNELDVPTTMHWHGIRNLNAMDGVPGLTQPAVEPGETFIYRFPLKDAGTFWYHAHNKGWEQLARGLYGPLVVHEAEPDSGPRDILLMADDGRLDDDYQIHEDSLGSLMDWSHQGRLGNWLTINGASLPDIQVPSGKVRLRLVNAANARSLTFQLGAGADAEIVALDAAPCTPFRIDGFRIAPAQRVDLIADLPEGATSLYELSGGQPFEAARLIAAPQAGEAAAPRPADPASASWYPRPDIAGARVVDIHMQGGAMGNLTEASLMGEMMPLRELATDHSKMWAFNGIVGGYDNLLADVARGETVVLRIWNDTRWEHAMHLHGQHFWVNSREFGRAEHYLLRDTYLMAPAERADLVFVADNPGDWLFHCHMMEHHAAGMGGVIRIA